MNIGRQKPGFIVHSSYLYLFGGSNDSSFPQKSSERLHPALSQWSPLHNMHYPRSEFTPCSLHSSIYIFSPSISHLEQYRPEIDLFTLIPLNCNPPNSHSTCLIGYNDGVMILFESMVWRVNLEEKLLTMYIDRYNGGVYARSTPVVRKGVVFLVTMDWGLDCREIHLNTLQRTCVKRLVSS